MKDRQSTCPRMVTAVDGWEWSSCRQYYHLISVTRFVDCDFILNVFGETRTIAIERFKEFNE